MFKTDRRYNKMCVDNAAPLTPDPDEIRGEQALDEVPSLAELTLEEGWQSVNLAYRTPLHLGTLIADNVSFSTSPCILSPHVGVTWLVVGCQTGQVCVWTLTDLPGVGRGFCPKSSNRTNLNAVAALLPCKESVDTLTPIRPVAHILTEDAAPITQMVLIPISSDHYTSSDEIATRYLVASNTMGTVSVLRCSCQLDLCHDPMAATTATVTNIEMVTSWNTGQCGIRSIAVIAEPKTTISTLSCCTILIGYAQGLLEAWVFDFQHSAGLDQTITSKSSVGASQLRWRGTFGHDSPAITGISPLLASGIETDTTCVGASIEDSTPSTTMPTVLASTYLLLSLQHEPSHAQSPTASMVRVINTLTIEEAWQQFDGTKSAVQLDDHVILADAMREIVDPAVSIRRHWIPGDGANRVESLPPHQAAVTLADGTVVVLSCHDGGAWGVDQQYSLPYPAMGIGRMRIDQTTFLVCCLRGSSTYLIPLFVNDTASHEGDADDCVKPTNLVLFPRASAFSLPHDIEEDLTHRYVQSFTAGHIVLSPCCIPFLATNANSGCHEIPILVYAWPSGVITVYSCDLGHALHPSNPNEALLRELFNDGSAELLRNALVSTDEYSDENDRIGWDDARQEILQYQGPSPLQYEVVCSSNEFSAFLTVLIGLCS